MKQAFWLFKTEPETYSFDQLKKDKKTNWNGVRNFQARNFLKNAAVGDLALIYHSGDAKAVVGIAQISRSAYPDPDPKKKGDWVQIDIVPLQSFKQPVTLAQIRSNSKLSGIQLVKQSRLSVMPISPEHYKILCQLGGLE